MVGHCAVRWWAMGKRSLEQKTAGEDDIRRMREIVREAIRGGALGFSTSRTMLHKTPDGEPVPGTFAAPDELIGIGNVLGEERRGVFEAVPYLDSTEADVIVARGGLDGAGEPRQRPAAHLRNAPDAPVPGPLAHGAGERREGERARRADPAADAGALGGRAVRAGEPDAVGSRRRHLGSAQADPARGKTRRVPLAREAREADRGLEEEPDGRFPAEALLPAPGARRRHPVRSGARGRPDRDRSPARSQPRRSLHGHRARNGRQGALHLPVREPGFRRRGRDALAQGRGARPGGLGRPLRPDHGREPADLLPELLGAREAALLDSSARSRS